MSNPADPNRSTRLYRAASPVGEEDIHPGAILGDGRFKIFGIIGRGKMASVFRARDLRRNADIALKVLARKYVGHHDRERRFDNEARLAGRLQGHRNVVAPIESGRLDDCGGRMFLAMELVRGPTLSDLVSMHGPLPIDDACMYVRDIARALRDLHQSGVVHRDVKPENVIVVETKGERVAKLLDFGLAADTGAGADARMTRMGERPGTRHYMSPEQAWDAPAHPVFDIYALGVTFFELLTGHPPFFELDEAEVIARKCDLSQPSPSIKGRREGLPESLQALVDACIEPVAKKRLPTINAFLKRLDQVTEGFGAPIGMSPRTRQQTSMVGQARTIAQAKPRKSKLPEMMAQAAAQKQQQPFVAEPAHVSPEAPTPDPDRVVSRRAVNRAVEGLAQSAAALGGQPATVPHLQPTAPSPQARQVQPAAGPGPGYGAAPGHAPQAQIPQAQINTQPHPPQPHLQAPYASQAQVAYASQSQAPHASQAQAAYASQSQAAQSRGSYAPQAHTSTSGPAHPVPAMGVAAPVRRSGPRPRRRAMTNNRAILFGLVVGAVLSALLVVGLWMWIQIRKGG
jgi:serine/threonine protein kinase